MHNYVLASQTWINVSCLTSPVPPGDGEGITWWERRSRVAQGSVRIMRAALVHQDGNKLLVEPPQGDKAHKTLCSPCGAVALGTEELVRAVIRTCFPHSSSHPIS